jgi:predicted DNA-binding transcriptional regulator YafY
MLSGGLMNRIQTRGLVDENRLRQAAEAFREAGEKGMTRQSLADVLGVSLRTADRARELLQEQGARFEPLARGQRQEKRFAMTKGPTWDTRISKEARLALRVAAQALSHGGGHLFADQLSSLEALADQAMTSRDRNLFQNLRKNVRVIGGAADDPTDEQAQVLESVLLAFSHPLTRELEVEYRRVGKAKPWALRFAPYCLTQDMLSGGTYILGWDVEGRRVLQLRTSRIAAAKVTQRPAVIPHPDMLERAARFQMGGWVSTEDPFEVKVRIRGTHWMQSLEEAQPDFPEFRVERERGGESVLATFLANHLLGPARWVLQMGRWAEVLEPNALREEVAESARDLLTEK